MKTYNAPLAFCDAGSTEAVSGSSAGLSVEEVQVQPTNLQSSEGDALIRCVLWLLSPGLGHSLSVHTLMAFSSGLHL